MTKKKRQAKLRYPKLGTDEALFQLMTVSGSSILKLLGMSATPSGQLSLSGDSGFPKTLKIPLGVKDAVADPLHFDSGSNNL